MPDDESKGLSLQQVSRTLSNLESRIKRIERELNIEPAEAEVETPVEALTDSAKSSGENLEIKIGLYWFAKVGIVTLLIGVVLLLLQPYKTLPPSFAPVLGCILAGGSLLISRFLKKTFPLLSGYLLGSALALLFFSTLRLHYFTRQPSLSPGIVETLLLLMVAIVSMIVSVRRKSVYLASISLSMLLIVALLTEHPYSFFTITLIAAVLTCCFTIMYRWESFLIYGVSAIYLTNLIWLLNNPLVGNQLTFRPVPYYATLLILLWPILFSVGTFFRPSKEREQLVVIINTLLNLCLGYGLFLLVTVSEFQNLLTASSLAASVVFMALAIAFWLKERSRYQTFFYAMTGYAALSIAIVAGFTQPGFFILLCWQSLLVVSTAIWFRSKFIVVTNFVIYSLIFLAYLLLARAIGIASLSFGVVALLSARILNWQQKRLELQTDKMRIAYLVAAFFIFPFALYHSVPKNYVSLSWLAVALVYYVISLVLKNMKYRWMALLTFLMTALYLIIVGITKLEPTFRILSFLALGFVLLVISFIYARTRFKSGS